MKRLTLVMLVAMIPFLKKKKKRGKKDKSNNLSASYEFMVITGYQLMAPTPEGMSDELAGPNGAELQAKLNMGSNMESRIIVDFDLSGVSTEDEGNLSGTQQYRSMSDAVNNAAKYGWEFINASVISEDKLKIHYYYMQRNK